MYAKAAFKYFSFWSQIVTHNSVSTLTKVSETHFSTTNLNDRTQTDNLNVAFDLFRKKITNN